jgi:cell wall-associated NlpC family hydrolase
MRVYGLPAIFIVTLALQLCGCASSPANHPELLRSNAEVAVTAKLNLGAPYRSGGKDEAGYDCSGFVFALYKQTRGVSLPRSAEQQAAATQKISVGDLQPGDLVFFNTLHRSYSHVGIYVGNHQFVHSPKSGARVRTEDMRLTYWSNRFDGARRVL